MARRERKRRWGWSRALGLALGLASAVALPARGQEEPASEGEPTLQVVSEPAPNDTVVILSDGVPPIEVRVRRPEVRTYETLHPIGQRSDPASIPTRGVSSMAVDVVYHGPSDYGEPTGIRTRRVAGTRVYQPITTHTFSAAPDGSRIRYHGGFR